MIKEDYVSFETAKLLKEKGFDYASFYCYEEKGDDILTVILSAPLSNSDLDNTIEPHKCYSAPTLQMAMKWLRENFDIHCQIDCPIAASNWVYGIRDLNKDEWVTDYRNMGDNDIYEEACEAAIKYCLENLI